MTSPTIMATATAAATAAMATILLLSHHHIIIVDALPSFGTKIPNGELVPCPSVVLDSGGDGCTPSGLCLGLGHWNCGGLQFDNDVSIDDETGQRILSLNPFGEDYKNQGFVWTRELCEMDSDGDGYTNGQELGDPCCTWEQGDISTSLDSINGFIPSHPGMDDDIPPSSSADGGGGGFVYDKTSLCGVVDDTMDDTTDVEVEVEVEEEVETDPTQDNNEEESTSTTTTTINVDQYYNPEEERASLEFRMKPYSIPVEETTYVDFFFNLPEDFPDMVHVVYGEELNSQPNHLHHFVMMGCSDRHDPSLDGLPNEIYDRDCTIPLGQWAPGSGVFDDTMTLDTGIAFGRSMGIESITLNVHYTDGVYEDPTTETFKIATDGIKIYYTPDLREYTSMRKHLINVPYGPGELFIPPSTDRFFVTRTCVVDTSCRDAANDQVQTLAMYLGFGGRRRQRRRLDESSDDYVDMYFGFDDDDDYVDSNISCETLKSFCSVDGFDIYLQRLCPVSCGLCGDTPDDADGTNTNTNTTSKVNPRDPLNYRVSSINYHAHLLGTEMYATLLREEEKEEDTQDQEDVQLSVAKKQADISSTPSMTEKDLKSREIWTFDNQETSPMDKEFVIDVDEDGGNDITMVKGVEVKAGDKIQVSCVYNSKNRNEPTYFGLSTYDEMCLIAVFVTFKTPSLDEISNVGFGTELHLRSFNCATDYENHTTDIWQGTLESDEDARKIWYDHPIETTDTCTYPVLGSFFDHTITGEARDCPEGEDDHESKNNLICDGVGVNDELMSSSIAGYTCEGGTYDQKDSNEAPLYVTRDTCIVEGGGTDYVSYTCSDAEFFLANEATAIGVTNEIREFLRMNWYQPKCCSPKSSSNEEEDGDTVTTQTAGALDVDDEDSSSSGAVEGDTVTTQTAAGALSVDDEDSSSSGAIGVFGNVVSYAVVASTLSMVMANIVSII